MAEQPQSFSELRVYQSGESSILASLAKSVTENCLESCFRGKGCRARRDEGEYPSWVFDRRSNKDRRHFARKPLAGGSFAAGRRWLGRYSPLRGCSSLAALSTVKIPRRRTPRNFADGL